MLKNPIKVLFLAALSLGFILTSVNASAANVSASLRFVPRDAILIAGVDGDRVQTTSLYKTFLSLAMQDADVKGGLAEFEEATGFDATKDVRSLVVALSDSFTKDDDNFVLIADAKLSEAKTLAFLKKKGAKFTTVRTRRGTHHLLGRKKKGFLAFRGRHVILGGAKQLQAVLAKKGPKRSLLASLATVKHRHVFIAMEPNAELQKKMAREHQSLGKLRTMAAGLDLTKGAKLNVNARFADAASAASFHDMVTKGVAQLAKSRQSKRMGFDAILKSIKLNKRGASLRGSLTLTQKQVDDIVALAIKLM